MEEIQDIWGDSANELRGLLGTNVGWRFWSPEIIRAITGSEHCAVPPLPEQNASHGRRIEAWGPLLPLFHFHLGWPRVDLGLARWAATGFDAMDDPTLTVIKRHWGPGLPAFVLWSVKTSGAPEPTALPRHLLVSLQRAAADADVSDPSELHLEGHWSLAVGGHWSGPYDMAMDEPVTDYYELRTVEPGRLLLIVPVYRGWYRILSRVGDALPAQPTGRSWRIELTIAPIGYVGTFRRSRVSGRWFTGRHRVHRLGIQT